MLRRLASAVSATLVLVPVAASLSGCGAGNGQLAVTIGSPDSIPRGQTYKYGDVASYSQYKPGDDATFTVAVVNSGPGSVTGVTIHVILPSGFHYRSTEAVEAVGATRTQPIDAAANSGSPIFGLWTLAPPGSAAAGTNSSVSITMIANAQGRPGPVQVQAFAVGDASAGQTSAAPYGVAMVAAAQLDALASVTPTSVKATTTTPSASPPGNGPRGVAVTYEIRVTNGGTGNAGNVGVLVTLPPVLTFTSSVLPFAGNGARDRGTNPIRNTLEVFYDGFLLPPLSNAGPGFVVIMFSATLIANAPPGTYPVDVSVTDDAGDTYTLHAGAPLTVR